MRNSATKHLVKTQIDLLKESFRTEEWMMEFSHDCDCGAGFDETNDATEEELLKILDREGPANFLLSHNLYYGESVPFTCQDCTDI